MTPQDADRVFTLCQNVLFHCYQADRHLASMANILVQLEQATREREDFPILDRANLAARADHVRVRQHMDALRDNHITPLAKLVLEGNDDGRDVEGRDDSAAEGTAGPGPVDGVRDGGDG